MKANFIITCAFHIRRDMLLSHIFSDSQNAEMPNSNSSVLSSFKLINVKLREDFFEDLLKNIGKYHLGKYCYNF
ncbi:hypothetical protein T07_5398 [Trichinella nelsoni]|uniref:Uncharacterized protein n=1 Tax=Trichinella nelsoni TaxID=6336 RepID=A0A0V0S091_9BILA|nr:hypothetical protein T07_5398 [Trichinella nelsoni]